jgi:large subunit ribosomal protein L15
MAGGHKHRLMYIMKTFGPDYFGRHGFKRPQSVVKADITINLSTLRERMDVMVAEGRVKKGKEGFDLDIEELGYTKLLGGGSIGDLKVHVLTPSASARAVEKIEAVGGSVTIKQE